MSAGRFQNPPARTPPHPAASARGGAAGWWSLYSRDHPAATRTPDIEPTRIEPTRIGWHPVAVPTLDAATYARLATLAKAEGVTAAEMVRRLVVDGEVLRGR